MSDEKRIERYEIHGINLVVSLRPIDGPWVKYEDHLDALGEVEKRADKAEKSREHTEYWYAVRLERIRDLAKEKGVWDEVATIIANGTVSPYEPPTHAQQLNVSKYRAEAAEEKLETLRSGLKAEVERTYFVLPAAAGPFRNSLEQRIDRLQALLDASEDTEKQSGGGDD